MAKPSVLVYAKPTNQPEEWRRFAAGLCFIFFYSQFVISGLRFSRALHQDHSSLDQPVPATFGLISAVLMLLIGKRLLQGRGVGYVIVFGSLALLLSLSASYLVADKIYSTWDPDWLLTNYVGMIQLSSQYLCHWHLLFLPILWISIRGVVSSRPGRFHPWVILAATWTIAELSMDYLTHGGVMWLVKQRITDLSLPVPPGVAMTLTLVVLVANLLAARRWAYFLPLLVGCLLLSDAIRGSWIVGQMVEAAVRALLFSSPHAPIDYEPWPFYTVLNDVFFIGVFVDTVSSAGPWCLIAWYAWKVPMRLPADDGSPYPRRYCGKCLYNLHGVEADRCPECGTELGFPLPSSQAVT